MIKRKEVLILPKDFLKKLLPDLSCELSIHETVGNICKYLTNSQVPNVKVNRNNFILIQNMLGKRITHGTKERKDPLIFLEEGIGGEVMERSVEWENKTVDRQL